MSDASCPLPRPPPPLSITGHLLQLPEEPRRAHRPMAPAQIEEIFPFGFIVEDQASILGIAEGDILQIPCSVNGWRQKLTSAVSPWSRARK